MRERTLGIAVSAIVAVAFGGACAYFAIYGRQFYGFALFLGVPFAVGFLVVALMRLFGPQTLARCMGVPVLSALALSLGFLAMGLEGIICIVMAIPLAGPPLIGGAAIAYWLFHERDLDPARSAGTIAFLLICGIVGEPLLRDEPTPRIVTDSVIVHASAADTWNAVVGLDEVPSSADWIFRAGVACPERTRIITPAAGGYRVCRLSTGNLIEQIEVFDPEHTLRWRTRSTPPPIREMNPFHPDVDPPHLHGYYDTPRGEFVLEALGPQVTRLTRRTWYSQQLYPQAYWNFWAELAISRIHRTVLGHVRSMSEAGRAGARV